jgi:hypothetical protein
LLDAPALQQRKALLTTTYLTSAAILDPPFPQKHQVPLSRESSASSSALLAGNLTSSSSSDTFPSSPDYVKPTAAAAACKALWESGKALWDAETAAFALNSNSSTNPVVQKFTEKFTQLAEKIGSVKSLRDKAYLKYSSLIDGDDGADADGDDCDATAVVVVVAPAAPAPACFALVAPKTSPVPVATPEPAFVAPVGLKTVPVPVAIPKPTFIAPVAPKTVAIAAPKPAPASTPAFVLDLAPDTSVAPDTPFIIALAPIVVSAPITVAPIVDTKAPEPAPAAASAAPPTAVAAASAAFEAAPQAVAAAAAACVTAPGGYMACSTVDITDDSVASPPADKPIAGKKQNRKELLKIKSAFARAGRTLKEFFDCGSCEVKH